MVHKSAQNNKITAAFRNDKDFAHPYTHVFTYLYYVQESGLQIIDKSKMAIIKLYMGT